MNNPTTCDITSSGGGGSNSSGGGSGSNSGDTFQIGETYQKGDIVIYSGKEYIATKNTKGAFFPNETSVWKKYVPAEQWNPNKIYLKDDYVIYDQLVYKAKWWTKGNIPASSSVVWSLVSDYQEIDPNTVTDYEPNKTYKRVMLYVIMELYIQPNMIYLLLGVSRNATLGLSY